MDWEELYGDFYGYGDDPDSLVIRPNCPSLGFEDDFEDDGDEGEAGFEDEDFPETDGDDWDLGDWESDEDAPEDCDDCGDDDYATREEDL